MEMEQSDQLLAEGPGSGVEGNSGKGEKCLGKELIGAYADNTLESSQRSEVEEHIASCNYCLRRFIWAREMAMGTRDVEEQKVPTALIEKAKGLVPGNVQIKSLKLFELTLGLRETAVRVLSTTAEAVNVIGSLASGMGQAGPDAVALRGAKSPPVEGIVIHRVEGRVDFRFEIVNVGGETCRVSIALKDARTFEPLEGLSINLCSRGRVLQSQPTDQDGEVVMESVPVGDYLVKAKDTEEWQIPLSLIKDPV